MRIEDTFMIDQREFVSRVSIWAKNKPIIKKIYLYGSRAKGIRKTGEPVGEDSDWDIALDIVPLEDDIDAWNRFSKECSYWEEELGQILSLSKGQLSIVPSQRVREYLKDDTIVVYDRNG